MNSRLGGRVPSCCPTPKIVTERDEFGVHERFERSDTVVRSNVVSLPLATEEWVESCLFSDCADGWGALLLDTVGIWGNTRLLLPVGRLEPISGFSLTFSAWLMAYNASMYLLGV